MFDATNQATIFLPMLVVAAMTFVAFVRMAVSRGKVAKQMPPEFYVAQIEGHEPEPAVVAVRHYHNLLELPTVVYPACLTAFVLAGVGPWTLVFAWGFAAMRVVQSAIHLTYNNPIQRGMAFALSVGFALALWINVGLTICARV